MKPVILLVMTLLAAAANAEAYVVRAALEVEPK